MPAALIMPDSDLPFSDRLKLRENTLAWISRDGGLYSFFFPSGQLIQLAPQQRSAYTLSVMRNYLSASTDLGKSALKRAMIRENAANIRRCIDKLRRNTVSHRDVARYCILLELLWDEMNINLSDSLWAKCSLHFDTSLISLRIVYICLCLREEYPSSECTIQVRAAAFAALVNEMFMKGTPLDVEGIDKHSTNFKDLLLAWRTEFLTYVRSASFEEKISNLEAVQGMKQAADLLDGFLREGRADESWMLRANQLSEDMDNGLLVRRTGRKRSRKNVPPSPVEELSEAEASDEDEVESKLKDDDFDPEDVIDVDDDDSDTSNGSQSSPRRLPVRPRRAGPVRRSPRNKSVMRSRRTRQYPNRFKPDDAKVQSPTKVSVQDKLDDLSEDDEEANMTPAEESASRFRRRRGRPRREEPSSRATTEDGLGRQSRRGVRQVPSADQDDRVRDQTIRSNNDRKTRILKAMSKAEASIHGESEDEHLVPSE